MKTLTYFFIAIVIVLFPSCNEQDENSYYKVETKLDAVIPISSFISSDIKSTSGHLKKEIPFSGTNDYNLRELADQSNQFSNIYSITPIDGSVLIIQTVREGFEISSLELHWGFKFGNQEDYNMMEPIDMTSLEYSLINGAVHFDLDEIAEQIIAEISNSKMMLRFSISGECNESLSGLANIQIPLIIESEVYTPRFEIF